MKQLSECPFGQESQSQDWSGYISNFGNGQEKLGKKSGKS